MTQNELIRLLRRLKLRLATGGAIGPILVPLVEVFEFSLSHGLKEVVIRARLRLRGPMITPSPPAYASPPDTGEPLSALTIPEMTLVNVDLPAPLSPTRATTSPA